MGDAEEASARVLDAAMAAPSALLSSRPCGVEAPLRIFAPAMSALTLRL